MKPAETTRPLPARAVPQLPQLISQPSDTLDRPTQRRLGVTPGAGFDQALKIWQEFGVLENPALPPTPGTSDPTRIEALTGLQFTLSALVLIPAMLIFEGIPRSLTTPGWALILYMAVASTFLPFYLYYRLLESMPATTVSLVGYLVPLVSLIGGVLLLGESIETGIVIGGALILTGMVVTDRAGRSRIPAVPD